MKMTTRTIPTLAEREAIAKLALGNWTPSSRAPRRTSAFLSSQKRTFRKFQLRRPNELSARTSARDPASRV
jgi:hypothetical protein